MEQKTSNHPITLESKVGELYSTPIGHDTLSKVLMQLGVSDRLITNGLVSNLKLKTIASLTRKQLGTGFFDTLLHLVNSEPDIPVATKGTITKRWWKEAIFYQIYPRSFYDTNGDGIGDLRGIIEKLDYLQELGVDALWLSPIYDSPNDDNGYDIRDYKKIMQEFGTMEDFDELLTEVHKRDMRLIMDLVINHTSDEHQWFQEALRNPQSKYRDYYHFRKGNAYSEKHVISRNDTTKTDTSQKGIQTETASLGGTDSQQSCSCPPPNNWTSFFSGPAWNYYEEIDSWALHLFSKKQMDLNWENEDMRSEVIAMINWWLDKGVDGFRMDVINYISKEEGLPQGNEVIGDMMGYTGIEHYYYGPKLHQYLREIQEKAFAPHNAFSVGETPGVGMKMCQLLTGEERKELDMVFSFDHLDTPGHIRMEDYQYDLNYFRDYIIDWMEHYGDNCWMSLFFNNHDNPRMISKITDDTRYHTAIAKLLAVLQLTLKGTPFIFQGDEMGLANYDFTSMEQITDVEAKGYYEEHIQKESHEKVFQTILAGTREHTRVLLPWNDTMPEYHAGLKQEIHQEVFRVYQELIAHRKKHPALVYGEFEVLKKSKNRFVYARRLGEEQFVIDCNLGAKKRRAYDGVKKGYTPLLLQGLEDYSMLEPYEARIWKM